MSDTRSRIAWLSDDVTDPDELTYPLPPSLVSPLRRQGRCPLSRRLVHGSAAFFAGGCVGALLWIIAAVAS